MPKNDVDEDGNGMLTPFLGSFRLGVNIFLGHGVYHGDGPRMCPYIFP